MNNTPACTRALNRSEEWAYKAALYDSVGDDAQAHWRWRVSDYFYALYSKMLRELPLVI